MLWDTTNVNLLGKPTHPDLQAATYSEYYSGNVLKGGVGMLPCGWLIAGKLFTGGITDTRYMVAAGILKEQQEVTENDDGPSFLNITDKGMHRRSATKVCTDDLYVYSSLIHLFVCRYDVYGGGDLIRRATFSDSGIPSQEGGTEFADQRTSHNGCRIGSRTERESGSSSVPIPQLSQGRTDVVVSHLCRHALAKCDIPVQLSIQATASCFCGGMEHPQTILRLK